MPKRKITTETTTVANKKNKITKDKEETRSTTNTVTTTPVKTGGTKDKKKSYPKLIDENTNTEKVSFIMFISFISSTFFFVFTLFLFAKQKFNWIVAIQITNKQKDNKINV